MVAQHYVGNTCRISNFRSKATTQWALNNILALRNSLNAIVDDLNRETARRSKTTTEWRQLEVCVIYFYVSAHLQ